LPHRRPDGIALPSTQGPSRPSIRAATEGAVFVACSTLCFARRPLEEALRRIGELHFSKFEVAIHESGCQLKPSEVAADVQAAAADPTIAARLLSTGQVVSPGGPAEFAASIEAQRAVVTTIAREMGIKPAARPQ